MLTFILAQLPRQLAQANDELQLVKESFSGITDPEKVLSFLQTPEFRVLIFAISGIALLTLVVHVWAWGKMLLEKEHADALSDTYTNIHTPPSQNFVPKALLWQSSRVEFTPEFGLIDHQPVEPESARGASTPTRGGDLPAKPTAR